MALELFDLKGKAALVTGGSKGLGLTLARTLADAGADVVIAAREPESLRAALDVILSATSSRGAWIAADLTDRAAASDLAEQAAAAFGKIDILVNNAGTNIVSPIGQVADADWDLVLSLNLSTPMALCRALSGRCATGGGDGSSTSARSSATSAAPGGMPTAPRSRA
jgi:NAD(P)-dependent dehydrogenase (short-subunit alcohol dehydrogenase family)